MVIGIGMFILGTILKLLFSSERPDEALWMVEPPGSGFPSGHSMISNSLYGLYFIILGMSTRKRFRIFISIWFFLTLIMGISRLYVGVHFPSDVVAGLGFCYLLFPAYFSIIRRTMSADSSAQRSK